MKKIYYLLAALSLLLPAKSYTQVTIGSGYAPQADALLDLKENADGSSVKGLLLPRVRLTNITSPARVKGMFVYNTNVTTTTTPKLVEGIYYSDGTRWWHVYPEPADPVAWSLTGNTGTNRNTNFLGTTDSLPLIVKVNGHYAGYFGLGDKNTAIGYNALPATQNITAGNSAFGYGALSKNVNFIGISNTAIGCEALTTNTIGLANTAVGYQALQHNVGGSDNTAIGYTTLAANTSGEKNVALGYSALHQNTTGSLNIAMGYLSLGANSTGVHNTAIGNNTFSYLAGTSGNNTALGYKAGVDVKQGSNNTFIGAGAGQGTSGDGPQNNNTIIGMLAGAEISGTSSNNIVIGYLAAADTTGGLGLKSGSYNILIGNTVASTQSVTGQNNVVIGNSVELSSGAVSNEVTIGTNGNTVGTYRIWGGSWSFLSDRRLKHNIKPVGQGLNFVRKLRPVEFVYNTGKGKSLGFIAQEVQQAMQEENMPGYNLVSVMQGDTLGLNTTELIPVLTKAIQEQQVIIDSQQQTINTQQQAIDALLKRVEALEQRKE